MSASKIDRYFKILGVTHNATPAEIKRAFRKKAKNLHPDQNPSEKAHEEFLELNEAVDFILELQKEKQKFFENKFNDFGAASSEHVWEHMVREKVKKHVKEHAKKTYHGYINSEEFKLYAAMESFGTHVVFLLAFFTVLILPIILISNFGITGIIMSVFANIFLLLFTMSAVRNLHKLNVRSFLRSIRYLIKTNYVKSFFIILFNLYIFIAIGLNTLIALPNLILSYLLTIVLAAGISYFRSRQIKKRTSSFQIYFITSCVAPGIISLFLTLNYLFSSNQTKESYSFKAVEQKYFVLEKEKTKKNGMIQLEKDRYEEYVAIRSFSSLDQLPDSGIVHYTFEKGLFGLTVLKGYRIE